VSRAQKRKKRLARFAGVMAAALLVVVLLNIFVVRQGRVRLSSMEPVLSDGDWILFEKLALSRGGPRRFDIVVFKAPDDPDSVFIKRVIGLPNEIVEARSGALYVDGHEVALPEGVDWGEAAFAPATVKAAHYFVVGDNVAESEDSRAWGPVPRDYVLGRVFWRFWPPGEWKIFRRSGALQQGVEDGDQGI
jgi:signal peptidase I